MSFADFHGNPEVVRRLREMLKQDRFPHAVILSGPEGAGKYTLALKLARAMNCLNPVQSDGLPDYCGSCGNCRRIGESEDLDARCEEAVEVREGMRDTDKREVDFVVLRDRKPLFAVECKSGEGSVSPAVRYFAERAPIPRFYQVHRGTKHFESGKVVVLPFARFCSDLSMP